MQLEDYSYPEDDISIDSFMFMSSSLNLVKPANYFRWTSYVHLPSLKKMKRVTAGVYETSLLPLNNIRRAITGVVTPYKVGTKDEDLFFVVNMASAPQGRKTPARLFFDSPQDFERHCSMQVSQEVKTKWLLRETKVSPKTPSY